MSDYRYEKSDEFPEGKPEDLSRCRMGVVRKVNTLGIVYHQCENPRGYGPGKAYCKDHARKMRGALE